MVAKRKKKYESGEGSKYMTRNAALKFLQLSLRDFRKLCILKGIYPREPRNRKRAQKGDTSIKTLYQRKDIQFLLHEPMIWKVRDFKIFERKVGRARSLRDFEAMKRYLSNHPTLKLDHIIKERYPTFIDAIRDLDDCLTLCFLFSTFPSIKHVPRDQSVLCRRLTVEFLHAVIAAKALRKVFISIKGYYYQAEIKGQTVTWIVPHHFSFEPQSKEEVDFRVMSVFVEFYTIMLGFVNFRLYHGLGLVYPPKFDTGAGDDSKELVDEESYVAERIAALNLPLCRADSVVAEEDDDAQLDHFPSISDPQKLEEAKLEAEKVRKLKSLFKRLKFFVNREVPREPLVFILRCFGGEVSWDKLLFVGATFDESDETITHQIVDRPSMGSQYLSRYYVQPQWIFDSVNARELLPTEKYFLGAVLPPHLSPFVNEDKKDLYIPPEEKELQDPSLKEQSEQAEEDSEESAEDEEGEEDVDDKEEEEEEEADVVIEEEQEQHLDDRQKKKKLMSVTAGTISVEDPRDKTRQERQEYKLREKMIQKKHRNLYRSMMKSKIERQKEIWLLRKKRRLHDEDEKVKRKAEKKLKQKANTEVEV